MLESPDGVNSKRSDEMKQKFKKYPRLPLALATTLSCVLLILATDQSFKWVHGRTDEKLVAVKTRIKDPLNFNK